jgi:purine-binding chemotaxis protein CheW
MKNRSPGNGKGSNGDGLKSDFSGTGGQMDAYTVTREMMEQIWAERAAEFAEVPSTEDVGERVDLLIVRLGRELYGLEANYVFRIRPAQQIAPVPRVPSWIIGVTNERGRILSVFDIRSFLGLSSGEALDQQSQSNLIIVETPEMELALLVDEVLEIQRIQVHRIQSTTDTTRSIPAEYVRGVVGGLEILNHQIDHENTLVVLDLGALLADERLIVNEEVA